MKRVLIVANMAATFGGNFIESMLVIQNKNSGGGRIPFTRRS